MPLKYPLESKHHPNADEDQDHPTQDLGLIGQGSTKDPPDVHRYQGDQEGDRRHSYKQF